MVKECEGKGVSWNGGGCVRMVRESEGNEICYGMAWLGYEWNVVESV